MITLTNHQQKQVGITIPSRIFSRAEHPLDGVAWQGVEEEGEEDDEADPEEDLDDGPLVVVPDDVPDGLDRVQEPHEGRVGTSEINI